jgi:hypothetical protein
LFYEEIWSQDNSFKSFDFKRNIEKFNSPQECQELEDVGYKILLDPTIFKQFVRDNSE